MNQKRTGRGRGATKLSRHDPPAFLPDFDEAQRAAWDGLLTEFFASGFSQIRIDVKNGGGNVDDLTLQYFDPTTHAGDLIVQPVTWNAFPKELLVRFGRQKALVEADSLRPLAAYRTDDFFSLYYDSELPRAFVPSLPPPLDGLSADFLLTNFYRPTVEYCEWHVEREPSTGRIARVAFTSEPPEYWLAMWGGTLPGSQVVFPDGREKVLALYRELVSPEVRMEDLVSPYDEPGLNMVLGGYNPYNKWNTTHGIAHLIAPPNSLAAEVQLGAEATVLHMDGAGNPVTDAQSLICCAGYGGVNRNSDPTIGATVNALARLGAMVTLPNPVGLYIDHIDLTGWETGDGSPPEAWMKIVRGGRGMIERLVVAPPPGSSRYVSDLTIGGEPVRFGGQIAECITVKLNGGAYGIGTVKDNAVAHCVTRCCVAADGGPELSVLDLHKPLVPGTLEATAPPGGYAPADAARPSLSFAPRSVMRHRNSARARALNGRA